MSQQIRPYFCECKSWDCDQEIKITEKAFLKIRATNPRFHIISHACTTPSDYYSVVEARTNYKIALVELAK